MSASSLWTACDHGGSEQGRVGIHTFGNDDVEANDVQILERGHDVAVRLGVLLGRVCRREGARRGEGVARRAEVRDRGRAFVVRR